MNRLQILISTAVLSWTGAIIAWADPGQIIQPKDDDWPLCVSCHIDPPGVLWREKSVEDINCRFAYGDNAPRRLYKGHCQRYLCADGKYGWTWFDFVDTGTCTADVLDDPTTCPGGTCAYVRGWSDAHMGGWSGDRVEPLTTAEAAKTIQDVMTPYGKK